MLVIILYTLLYIEKEQKQREREGQRLDGLPSFPPRPLPLLQVVREGKSKAADETGRKRTRAKDAAAIFARPLPLFCSVCCLTPSAPSPALTLSPAHAIAKGKGRTATPSPSSSPPSGGESRAASQPGRAIPCLSACRPSPPCRGASEYMRTPPKRGRAAVSHSRAAGLLGEKVCFGIFCAVVSL